MRAIGSGTTQQVWFNPALLAHRTFRYSARLAQTLGRSPLHSSLRLSLLSLLVLGAAAELALPLLRLLSLMAEQAAAEVLGREVYSPRLT
jgi:hypothetical protein